MIQKSFLFVIAFFARLAQASSFSYEAGPLFVDPILTHAAPGFEGTASTDTFPGPPDKATLPYGVIAHTVGMSWNGYWIDFGFGTRLRRRNHYSTTVRTRAIENFYDLDFSPFLGASVHTVSDYINMKKSCTAGTDLCGTVADFATNENLLMGLDVTFNQAEPRRVVSMEFFWRVGAAVVVAEQLTRENDVTCRKNLTCIGIICKSYSCSDSRYDDAARQNNLPSYSPVDFFSSLGFRMRLF